MGALHHGHLELLRAARRQVGPSGTVVISIFVNPIQFDRPEDLSQYPQPLSEDLRKCQHEGVNIAFTPATESLYHPDRSVTVTETLLTQHLCGETRPGHFDGVCTVVLKLLNLVLPDLAIFGQKDYQQLAIIKRMVRDLDVPVEIIGHPTVREPDGLAMSSRNRNLAPADRQDAPRIRRALLAASHLTTTGEQNPQQYLDTARHHLLQDAPPHFTLDYLELLDASTLQRVAKVTTPCVLATACFYQSVRLIDNSLITPS